MKSYIKIVKAMFSGNKRVLAEAFSVMVILLALEMTIPVCVNKMIDSLAVENGIVTFLGGIFLFACAYGIVCFLLYRKFLKSSEIVYNRLEIKNDIAKERRGLRHDVVYEVFCFGLG